MNDMDITFKSSKGKDIIKNVRKEYESYIDHRDELPFAVDGLVFEFVDEDIRDSLGRDVDRNRWEFALKFPYQEKKSIVEDIEFYVSTNGTGRITPVVKFEDVRFSRAVCNHVSRANYDRFKKLKLAKGDSVIISYRNDVLSYLNFDESTEHVGKPIKFISRCPVCHEKLKLNDNKTFVNCVNPNCPAIEVGKYNNFLIKLGIDSVRENTLTDLYNAGLLKDLTSLYSITVKDITKIEGYKTKSAENIVNSIHSKMELFDYELLGSLGWENIGIDTCKLIFKKFTIDNINEIIDDEFDELSLQLVDIDGIGNKTAEVFERSFTRDKKLITKLRKILTIKDFKSNIKTTSEPKNIVFTGFRNGEIQKKLELSGHTIKSSVSKKTDILVEKELGSGSVKEQNAKKYGIPIYQVDDFIKNVLPELLGE